MSDEKTIRVEVVDRVSKEVVKSFDTKAGRGADKLERGVNINLDHKRFFTRQVLR